MTHEWHPRDHYRDHWLPEVGAWVALAAIAVVVVACITGARL